MMENNHELEQSNSDDKKKTEEGITIKHDKEGISIYITIYNTNNLANEGGSAGVRKRAETGGQISGNSGENANQGGQIAEKCGQNANQDGRVDSQDCGCSDEEVSTCDE